MKITLDQNEIESAIIAFVGNQGIAITGKKAAVTLVAGRAPNGMSANIEISDDSGDTVVDVKTSQDVAKAADPVVEEEAAPEVDASSPPAEEEVVAAADSDEEEKPLFGN